MSAIGTPRQDRRRTLLHRASISGLLAAAILFLGSAALQFIASVQRWTIFRATLDPETLSAEDHLYDYFFPLDPWESVGATAQLFGWAALMQAAGVLFMTVGVLAVPPVAPVAPNGRFHIEGFARFTGAGLAIVELSVACLVAAWFAFIGAHALISGIAGSPSPLQDLTTLWLVGFVGPFALGLLWLRRLPGASAACMFLLGSTVVGYFAANFIIAPLFTGGTSHDTTPWMEAVMAASTAAAGIALVFGAGATSRHRRDQSDGPAVTE